MEITNPERGLPEKPIKREERGCNRSVAAQIKEKQQPSANRDSPSSGWLLDIARTDYKSKCEGSPRNKYLGVLIHSTKGRSNGYPLIKARDTAITWHFTILKDGTIHQHVALGRTATHAGAASMVVNGRKKRNVSSITIGIELVNAGPHVQRKKVNKKGIEKTRFHKYITIKKDDPNRTKPSIRLTHETGKNFISRLERKGTLPLDGKDEPIWWEAYPSVQIDALVKLLRRIQRTKWASATANIVRHSEVADRPVGRKVDPGANFPWHRIMAIELHQKMKMTR